MTNPIGKGFTTSEFAATIAGVIVSLLISMGVIDSSSGKNLQDLLASAITGVVAIISIWGIIAQYVHGRNQIKQTMITQGINTSPVVEPPVAPTPSI